MAEREGFKKRNIAETRMNTGLSRYVADATMLRGSDSNFSDYLQFLLTSHQRAKSGNSGIQPFRPREPAFAGVVAYTGVYHRPLHLAEKEAGGYGPKPSPEAGWHGGGD